MPPADPGPKTIAILQSNYIPWKGYFDLIASVDEFILFDSMQFTRRDWRNRNRIKTATGPVWLTIPVQVKGKYHQKISETRVSDSHWAAHHWRTIELAYAKAPFFHEYAGVFETIYTEAARLDHLSEINRHFLTQINAIIGIDTPLVPDTDSPEFQGKTERLIALCQASGATDYISGPAARAYIDESLFTAAGINLRWMNYENYPHYTQLHPPFDHHVSILDLIFNVGPGIPNYMKNLGRKCIPTRS